MPRNPFGIQRRNAKIADLLDIADFPKGPRVEGFRLGLSTRPVKGPPIQPQQSPAWWKAAFPQGSYPEFLTLDASNKLGLKASNDPRSNMRGTDFTMQFQIGQARAPGSSRVDFVYEQPNRVAVFVNGLHWHPAYGLAFVRQIQQYGQLGRLGYRNIAIDETSLYQDALHFVREAVINLRSHSIMAQYGG